MISTVKPTMSTVWCMPNKWTFKMPPVRDFVARHLVGCDIVVDPFCGESEIGTLRNDLGESGICAEVWCRTLIAEYRGMADAVLFDPPYSPRQIADCYKGVGRIVGQKETQSARLYKSVREPLAEMLKPGGIALSFGWNSTGFGKQFETIEILLVRHGGAHNDTICVAQRKPV